MEDFDRKQDQWQHRQGSDYNPYQSCSDHKDCKNVDMNMICAQSGTIGSAGSRSCQCRDDMKWNDEGLECQIYIVSQCLLPFRCLVIPKNEPVIWCFYLGAIL